MQGINDGTAGRLEGVPLRVLFSMRNLWYVKAYESVIRELAARGHLVHVLSEPETEGDERVQQWSAAATTLARECPGVTFAAASRLPATEWTDLRWIVRLGLDHLRFRDPQFADTPAMAARARSRAPAAIAALGDHPVWGRAPFRRSLMALLRLADRALPVPPEISEPLLEWRPDVVLVTPLVELGSDQVDVVRVAKRAGIPTVLAVGSWDHLSSKALIRERPDRVLVWNDTQRDEAVRWHGMRADAIVVTGAQSFDQWFDRTPALDREAFCRKVGLRSDRPYVLYVCSALFEGSPIEAEFVTRWIEALRTCADPRLREAGVLVRPHPKRPFEWNGIDVAHMENVSLWPPRAAGPFDSATKEDYFDSLHHCASVVGLNTSALIEGAIAGRPVHTILLPEFRGNQEGTLHFRYLLDGGLLHSSRDLESHLGQLAAALRDPDTSSGGGRAFVERFVRPGGMTTAATPLVADAVEKTAHLRVSAFGESAWIKPARAMLRPLARRLQGTFVEEVARRQRYDDKRRRQTAHVVALEDAKAARVAAQAQKFAEHRARKIAAVETRRAEAARRHAERAEARQGARDALVQQKERRMGEWRREKKKRAFNARLSAYYRRLLRPFLPSR